MFVPEGLFYSAVFIIEEGKMLKLFAAGEFPGGTSDEPVYIIRDGKFHRTVYHPEGWTEKPDYELRSDGKIYRTRWHRLGKSENPDYMIGKDMGVYRVSGHPEQDGRSGFLDFILAD